MTPLLLALALLGSPTYRTAESIWNFNPDWIDPAFKPHLVAFLEEAAQRGRLYDARFLAIRFVTQFEGQPTWLGAYRAQTIEIKRSSWMQHKEPNWRRLLLFHELGHWIGRDHPCETKETDTCKWSDKFKIMYPYLIDPGLFEDHHRALVDCLFEVGPCPGW